MNKLISANEARLQKALSKQYRFSDGSIKPLGQYLEEHKYKLVESIESKIEYNRRKYNNMNITEQDEYEKKLAVKVTRYYAEFADGSMFQIPNLLATKIKTRLAERLEATK